LYNVDASMGGVLHAKYFIVDGRDAYLGSQNFDWRSLTHIQELGVRVRDARLARAYLDVFEMDWAAAGAQAAADRSATARADARPGEPAAPEGGLARGDTEARLPHLVIDALAADTVRVAPVASPRGWLPESTAWELPHLIALIDHARQRVRVQLLSYRANGRGGTSFDELEAALQRAAGRGVSVQLLLADWCKRAGTIEGLQELEPVPGIDVRLVTIPAWSGGFVPYARVIHAKYMVVDGSSAWIGTSNWERDYFYDSRNVGLIIEGGELPARLDRFFEEGWDGPYASPVDPDARYAAPHIGE
jgi:phosphatidylserine/phosphatidylglycerophosphate/cardiolipin synthase-like enzyme